jgi:hypothetical protein
MKDDQQMLFNSWTNQSYICTLESGECTQLPFTGTNFHYIPTGHLIYNSRGRLLAVPVNSGTGQLGSPFPLIDRLRSESLRYCGQFDYSDNGILVYLTGLPVDIGVLQLVDKEGRVTSELPLPPENFEEFFISPDNQKILFGNHGIYSANPFQNRVYDLRLNLSTYFDIQSNIFSARWAPDNIIYFTIAGEPTIYRTEYGKSDFEKFYTGDLTHTTGIQEVSDNGEFMILRSFYSQQNEFSIISLLDTSKILSPFDEDKTLWAFDFSHDNKYIAYTSNETGRYEVYVIPWPATGQKWQISSDGGMEPKWSYSRKEIYFRSLDMKKMMVAGYEVAPSFVPDKCRVLWEGEYLDIAGYSYDITPEGENFLMKKSSETRNTTTRIELVTNWFDEIRQLESNR